MPYSPAAWLSLALCLRDGVPLLDGEDHDRVALIEDWSSGKLWFERTGERIDVSDRYPQQGMATRLQGEARDGGNATGVATIISYAADGGCPLRPDDEPRHLQLSPELRSELLRTDTTLEEGEAPATTGPRLLRSFMGAEILTIVSPRWLARTVIPIPAVGIEFGRRGVFKTGVALGALAAVLTGTKMFGQFDCEQGAAVLVAGEGLPGLRRRIEAQAAHHGLTMSDFPLLVIGHVPRIASDDEWVALVATIEARGLKNVKLIIIDHLSIMLGGADQNDATVATQAMQRLQALSAHFNCTIICLAHAGKEDDREVRGSSAFLDNVDFAYELKRVEDSDIVKLRCAKMRDGEAPEPFHLKANISHGAPVMVFAGKDDAKRAAGQAVGLRNTDVAAALKAMGACPGGANEWTGSSGGIPTKDLATEIARLRHEAAGDGQEPSAQEISTLVTGLNREALEGGAFSALVVANGKRRLWAIAPGSIAREHDRG